MLKDIGPGGTYQKSNPRVPSSVDNIFKCGVPKKGLLLDIL